MTSVDQLRRSLEDCTEPYTRHPSISTRPLSDVEYRDAFNMLKSGEQWETYKEFIFPQLSQLLSSSPFDSRTHISVLEIGPGPKSVLGSLPRELKQKISRYSAFEPNQLFAKDLEKWLHFAAVPNSPFPCLETPPDIRQVPFSLADTSANKENEKYDLILFCHSMYDMKPQHKYITQALQMLADGGMVVVFHDRESLHIKGLVSHRTAYFPTGLVSVSLDPKSLVLFSAFLLGYAIEDENGRSDLFCHPVDGLWVIECHTLGRYGPFFDRYSPTFTFSSPNIMVTFTKNATSLKELTPRLPLVMEEMEVKNREARLHHPASIVRPTNIKHVQECVTWAARNNVSLTVVGGGHSGHCLWPNVVAVDMSAFNQIHVLKNGHSEADPGPLVIVEAGCNNGDIIRKTMAEGLTVPLGSCSNVGAGQWLQGGIGHLARLYGLTSDAIVGVVMVQPSCGSIIYHGQVPREYRPPRFERSEDKDLLWAIKGGGTNFGIVISVTFKAYPALNYYVRNWIIPADGFLGQEHKLLKNFDELVAKELPRNCSSDAYLHWINGKLHLGVAMYGCSTAGIFSKIPTHTLISTIFGPECQLRFERTHMNGIDLLETEKSMPIMPSLQKHETTSSFKRCLFLKDIGKEDVATALKLAIKSRPSQLCYLHLLQGGGAVGDIASNASAFGCRDWDFACVVTGVWVNQGYDPKVSRDAAKAVNWVYKVCSNLLPLSSGVYAADLGPDPRDAALAVKAFGPNQLRLVLAKGSIDIKNTFAYACPLPKIPVKQRLIVLVTGEHGVGKDYCAGIWVSVFTTHTDPKITARSVSISDETKREYATATGADLNRLLSKRSYKEKHRPALTKFFQDQLKQRPRLLEEHFLNVVRGAVDVDVLLITGMKDEAPVAAFSHLVPDSRLIEVRVEASEETRQIRRGQQGRHKHGGGNSDNNNQNDGPNPTSLHHHPDFIFDNNAKGGKKAKMFATERLLFFFSEDLQMLPDMVRLVPDFPRPGINFRDVLSIAQQDRAMDACLYSMIEYLTCDWEDISVVVGCEASGFIFASPAADHLHVPLAIIRKAGKIPPPTISITKPPSHISSVASSDKEEESIEMGRDVIPPGGLVWIVDDVLATGTTLCAVLQLLVHKAGISMERILVSVVAEFPVHRGRQLLRQRGFGRVRVQSLLVFDGA
ncbi:hypothetical protein F4810DRAFT_722424 [Camillea tinctor]|nr:hypothetical protein F4810DRAFT_722424 [Camillea tinctor]